MADALNQCIHRTNQSIGERDIERWMNEAQVQPGVQLGAAGNFGSKAHDLFELMLKGKTPVIPTSHSIVASNFSDWLQKQQGGLTIIATEVTLWSDKHLFAGTADALGRTADGRLVVLDWKTGNR